MSEHEEASADATAKASRDLDDGDDLKNRQQHYTKNSGHAQAPSVAERLFDEHGGSDFLDAGLRAAQRGWRIFPCNGKKEPLTAHGFKDATTDEQQIRTWAKAFPGGLWGYALPEDIVVVDLDLKHGNNGIKEFEKLQHCKSEEFVAPRVATATGGMHLYTVAGGQEFKNTRSAIASGIDTKTSGGYVIIPSGPQSGYRWQSDPDTSLPLVPRWTDVALRRNSNFETMANSKPYEGPSLFGNVMLESACDAIRTAPGGKQEPTLNDRSYQIGRYIGGGLLERGQAINDLVIAGLQMVDCDPSWEWTENTIREYVEYAVDAGILKPLDDGTETDRRTQEILDRLFNDPQYAKEVEDFLEEEDAKRSAEHEASGQEQRQPDPPKQGPTTSNAKPEARAEKPKAKIHATPYIFTAPSLLKPRQYIYKPGYVRKFTSMTIATTKVGKSSKSIVEALAMVTGKALLGVLTFAPVRVWYWNGEDPQEENEKRVAGACKHYGITEEDIGGRLFIDSGRDMPIKIAELGRHGTTVAVPTIKGVIEALNDNKIDVFICDPFVSTHRVTENDNNAIQQVAEQWAHIADTTNTAVRYNHHTRKTNGEAVDFESQRGASSNFAAVRYAEVLNYMTEKEAEDAGLNPARRKFHFREDFESNLYPPAAENAVWYEKVSVDLENAVDGYESDKIGVVAQWNYPQADNSDITLMQQAVIRTALLEREAWRADQQAKDWVGQPIAGVLGLDLDLKVNRKRVKGIVEKLVAWGVLHPVTVKVNRTEKEGYTAHPLQGGIPF